jgi:large subunit ribosomal protein L41
MCRRKMGTTYRKTLGLYNYKLGHQQYHKEPGAIKLNVVESLK